MRNGATIRVIDLRTNRQWNVEVIQPRRHHRAEFGESLREFCDGAISERESRISATTHYNVRYVRNPCEIATR